MRSSWEPAEFLYYMLCSGKSRGRPSFRMFTAFVALFASELATFYLVFPLRIAFTGIPSAALPFAASMIGAGDAALSAILYFRVIPDIIPERVAPEEHEAIGEFVGLACLYRMSLRFLLPLPFAAEFIVFAVHGIGWVHALQTGLLALFFLLCHVSFLALLDIRMRSIGDNAGTHETDIYV